MPKLSFVFYEIDPIPTSMAPQCWPASKHTVLDTCPSLLNQRALTIEYVLVSRYVIRVVISFDKNISVQMKLYVSQSPFYFLFYLFCLLTTTFFQNESLVDGFSSLCILFEYGNESWDLRVLILKDLYFIFVS